MSELRKQCDARLLAMESEAASWFAHYRELANYILPRRYRWLVTTNQQKGSPINQHIIDSTATVAARTLAAGMMAGITSPSRPWFKLKIAGFANDESHPVSIWLAECERRMLRVFQESNFYGAMATLYFDLVIFGTAVNLIYEDSEDVIRCFNPCAGEYYIANSSRLSIDTVYRKLTMTIKQLAEEFGRERCSPNVQNAYDRGGASLLTEIIIGHAIEPNIGDRGAVPRHFPYREIYWELGSAAEYCLRQRGFEEFLALVPRWDLSGNDAQGRSPAMDALPDVKQLQQETKRKAQAIDKMVNPPMVADVQLRNQPASLLPGGVTYVHGVGTEKGFRPAYEVQPRIQEMMLDIQEIQTRIKRIFHNDLFMMFQELQAEPRSAAAVDARREEKLIMLGPVLERIEGEGLDPAIERTFSIMTRRGLLPPPPAEIQGAPIQVVYVSMLAESQRAAASSGLERTFALAGNLAAINPEILDNVDFDEGISEFASLMATSPKLIRDRKAVEAIRVARVKEKEQMQLLQMTDAAVKGAKTLSETDVGGGANALQTMMGAGA